MKLSSILKASALCVAIAGLSMPAMAETVRLTGSGASFPAPLYTTWFKDFGRVNKNIQINYQSKGSGAGVRDFQNGTVDFAASDSGMSEEQIASVKQGVQLLPMTAGEVVLAYNLKEVPELKLPREVYIDIFLGKIKKWNDPKIAAANTGATLPDQEITVVTRADSSGTSFVFTQHLSAISPEFKEKVGSGNSVNWPGETKMVKSPKNDGVTATITQTPGSIGYIEYGFAQMSKLPMALLENKSGKFVAPGGEGGPAALAGAEFPENMLLWVSDPEADNAYPIVTYTWMIFSKKYDDPKKAAALQQMIAYGLGEGQKIATKAGYIELPPEVITKVQEAAKLIQ
ncbi:MAG: phosphate ABC transporter substrate-binding protein PstS [Desulfobulbaceae bacterium]|nr:phosphate ABC transporter substrate-binding protein PstS [Desulfobulbaceae bacterium]